MAFPRQHRLQRRKDIAQVLRKGRRVNGALAGLAYLPNGMGQCRFAVIVPKKVAKKSVERNTLRRRSSAWIALHTAIARAGYDAVLLFRGSAAAAASRKELYAALENLFRHSPLL